MIRVLLLYTAIFFSVTTYAKEVLNVYVWGGEIPYSLIQKFENRTGVKINYSTYDSNEVLYAKLKTTHDYDVILPSSYFVEKLIKKNLLVKLHYKKIPNTKNLNPVFTSKKFDDINGHSIPFAWGSTGLFYNQKSMRTPLIHWHQLWQPQYKNKLLLLDDPRDAFAVALIKLGYSPNDNNVEHIKAAYEALIKLQPNIKLLATNAIPGLIIDEDLKYGVVWNGELVKVGLENYDVTFHLPVEGFPLALDCLAILKSAPHKENAYRFINFLLEKESGAASMIEEGFSSTNIMAYQLLPKHLKDSQVLNPPMASLANGILLKDLTKEATKAMIHYWQAFKLNF